MLWLNIDSLDEKIYTWTFRIVKSMSNVCIGIDETKHIRIKQGNFANKIGKSKSYALWSDGDRSQWDVNHVIARESTGAGYQSDDIVCMTLDLSLKTLSYKVNDNDAYEAFPNITVGKDIEYCMGIYIFRWENCVELLSCKIKNA